MSIFSWQLWPYLPKGYFYKGVAFTFLIITVGFFLDNRRNFYNFLFLCLALNNLFDEFIGNPLEFGLNEVFFGLICPILWIIKKKRNARKTTK